MRLGAGHGCIQFCAAQDVFNYLNECADVTSALLIESVCRNAMRHVIADESTTHRDDVNGWKTPAHDRKQFEP